MSAGARAGARSGARAGRAVTGALLALLVAMVPLASGCVVASPDTNTYDDAARQALRSVISEATTVEKLLHLLIDDDIPRPPVVAQLRYSEQGLQGATSWFTGLNQPPGSDATAARLGLLMQDAGNLVANARVAIHRNQKSQYSDIAHALDKVVRDLQKAEGDVP